MNLCCIWLSRLLACRMRPFSKSEAIKLNAVQLLPTCFSPAQQPVWWLRKKEGIEAFKAHVNKWFILPIIMWKINLCQATSMIVPINKNKKQKFIIAQKLPMVHHVTLWQCLIARGNAKQSRVHAPRPFTSKLGKKQKSDGRNIRRTK